MIEYNEENSLYHSNARVLKYKFVIQTIIRVHDDDLTYKNYERTNATSDFLALLIKMVRKVE